MDDFNRTIYRETAANVSINYTSEQIHQKKSFFASKQYCRYFHEHGYVSNVPIFNNSEITKIKNIIFPPSKHDPITGSPLKNSQTNKPEFPFYPAQELNIVLNNNDLWDLIMKNERILQMSKEIFETENIIYLSSTLFTKYGLPDENEMAGNENNDKLPKVGWHQDHYFWNLQPKCVFTLWIALDSSTKEKGCLTVIPKSHTHGLIEHDINTDDKTNILMAYQDINPKRFAYMSPPKAVELNPGEGSFHCGFLIHGSAPNLSSERRAGLTIQLIPGNVEVGENLYSEDKMEHRNEETVGEEDWRKPVVVSGIDELGEGRKGVGLWR